MLKEIDIFGVYVSPFVIQLLIAVAFYGCVRCLCNFLELQKYVWHPALVDVAVFIIILGIIVSISTKV
jgi:hypothetical protein